MIEKARERQLGSGTEKGEITILGLIPLVAHPRLLAIVPSSGSLEQATVTGTCPIILRSLSPVGLWRMSRTQIYPQTNHCIIVGDKGGSDEGHITGQKGYYFMPLLAQLAFDWC